MTVVADEFVDLLRRHEKKIIIYGAGMVGKNFGSFLCYDCGIQIDNFCDGNSQLWGEVVENNIICLSLDELIKQKEKYMVIIAVGLRKDLEEIDLFFEQNNVRYYITWLELIKSSWLKNKFCITEHICELSTINKKYDWKENYKSPIQKHKKVAVYTFITKGYDKLHQPLVIDKNTDYYVISDDQIDDLGIYKQIEVASVVPQSVKNAFMQNRYCKMHGADIFKDYDYSIYLDGALQIAGNITDYLDQVGKTGIALYLNEDCECIYETGILITMVGRCDFKIARSQLNSYAIEGMPANYGLLCGGYIFRDNKNPIGNKLMESWWNEYQKWPTRDQLCLTYVMWKMRLQLGDIGIINNGQNRLEDQNIIHHAHCYINRHVLYPQEGGEKR